MFLCILRLIIRFALSLRYRIRVTGLQECVSRGNRGVLFLPNHPALIDPVILSTVLYPAFRPRPLVNEKQVRASALKYIAGRIRLLCLPDMEIAGKAGRKLILRQIDACVEALRSGDNLMFYPAGRIYRCRRENLRGNGGVARILEAYPDVRIVLVRTKGLWGSEFSRGKGYQISFGECIQRHLRHLLLNGFFFMPRRPVDIELVECPPDFPRHEEKDILNRYLENFYNQAETGNLYVPYCWYERGGIRCIPEPDGSRPVDSSALIAPEVRDAVFARLHDTVEKKIIKNQDMLRTDLALEYDQIRELCRWIEERFQVKISHPENLKTVGSLLMAAAGEENRAEIFRPVEPSWFLPRSHTAAKVMVCEDIVECLIQMVRENPERPVVADQQNGVKTCRQIMQRIFELKTALEKIPYGRVALMTPAGYLQTVFYLSLVLARKIPVLIPPEADSGTLGYCLEQGECRTVLADRSVVERLTAEEKAALPAELQCMQDILRSLQPLEQICAAMQSFLNWLPLCSVKVNPVAAVLFVSRGQDRPEMITLPHRAVREYLLTAVENLGIRENECLLHASSSLSIFSFLTNLVLPFCCRLRLVYAEHDSDAGLKSRLISAYGVTVLSGSGREISEVLGTAEKMQLKTLDLIVVEQGERGRISREKMQKTSTGQCRLEEFPFIG